MTWPVINVIAIFALLGLATLMHRYFGGLSTQGRLLYGAAIIWNLLVALIVTWLKVWVGV